MKTYKQPVMELYLTAREDILLGSIIAGIGTVVDFSEGTPDPGYGDD